MRVLAALVRWVGELVVVALLLTVTAWRWGWVGEVSWGAILDVALLWTSVVAVLAGLGGVVLGALERHRKLRDLDVMRGRLEEIRRSALDLAERCKARRGGGA